MKKISLILVALTFFSGLTAGDLEKKGEKLLIRLCTEKNKEKALKEFKKAVNPENQEKAIDAVENSNLTEAQKVALIKIINKI